MRLVRLAALAALFVFPGTVRAQDCLDWNTEARVVWTHATDAPITGLERFGDALYALASDGLHVYDVSDPAAPVHVMSDSLLVGVPEPLLAGDGAFLYAVLPAVGIQVYDLSAPLAPTRRGAFNGIAVDAHDVALVGNSLYLARDTVDGVQVVDVTDPDAPAILGTILTNGYYDQVWTQGTYLLAYSQSLGEIASLADGSLVRSDVRPVVAFPPAVKSGDRIHLSNVSGELITIDVSDPTNMSVEATVTYDTGSLAFASGGLLYADSSPGLRVHDPSVPSAPVELERLAAPRSSYDAVAEKPGFLYLATSYGLAAIALEDHTDAVTITEVAGVTTQFRSIDVDGGLAVYGGNGIGIVDVSDPANATQVGFFGGGVYLSLGVAIHGSTVYTSTLNDSMAVIDVSTPSMPEQLRTVAFPDGRTGREFGIAGGVLYTIVIGPGGVSAIAAYDLTDPVNPAFLGMSADLVSTIEDIEASGTRVAWQSPSGTIGVVDFTDPTTPVELPTVPIADFLVDVAFDGDLVLVAGSDGVTLVSYANPQMPTVVSTLDNRLDAGIASIAFDRHVAYVATFEGIVAYDVSDPSAPVYVGDQPVVAQALAVAPGAILVGTDDTTLLVPHCPPPDVPTLVSSFSSAIDQGAIVLSWKLTTSEGGAEFRVQGVRGATIWDVPVERTASGVVAVDRSVHAFDGGAATYELSMRQGTGAWLVVDRVDVTPIGARARSILYPAAPNPFNPRTTLRFDVARAGEVELTVHDVAGRRVRTLVSEPRTVGTVEIVWDGLDDDGATVASGVYLVRLRTEDALSSQKIGLIR